MTSRDSLKSDDLGIYMEIRIISFNMHKGLGWMSWKSTLAQIQSYLHEQNPDIIFLQEVRGLQLEMIASGLFHHFSYGKNLVYKTGHHGNAILSKFPIHFSKNIDISMHRFERRGLLHNIVTLASPSQRLHLLCLHLGLFQKDREKQLKKIIEYMQVNIPENEALIVGGDFNDWQECATDFMIKSLGFSEAFLNSQGSYAKTYPAWAPLFKLDRIYMRGFTINKAHRLTQNGWRLLSDHIAIEAYLQPELIIKKE